EDIGRGREDMAAHDIRFHDVEYLARGCPNDFNVGGFPAARDGVLHDWPVVNAEICEAAGKHRHAGWRTTVKNLDSACDLLARKDGCHVDFDAIARKRTHDLEEWLTARVRHRQFDINILAPRRDDAGLRH